MNGMIMIRVLRTDGHVTMYSILLPPARGALNAAPRALTMQAVIKHGTNLRALDHTVAAIRAQGLEGWVWTGNDTAAHRVAKMDADNTHGSGKW